MLPVVVYIINQYIARHIFASTYRQDSSQEKYSASYNIDTKKFTPEIASYKQERRLVCMHFDFIAIALFSRCFSRCFHEGALVQFVRYEVSFSIEEQSQATYIGQARCQERLSLCRFDMRLLLAVIDGDEGAGNRIMFAELSGGVGCETCRPHP